MPTFRASEAPVKTTWVDSSPLVLLLLAVAGNAHAQTPPQNAAADLGGTSWRLVNSRAATTPR